MKSYISLILLLLLFCSTRVQKGLTDYLSAHRYPFTLEKGFDPAMADTLERRLAGYRMILQAEGGSHYLTFYNGLQLCWLQFLQKHLGLRHFVGESGHASAVLLNQYLQTGDSAYIIARGKPFWRDLYSYNATLSDKEKIHYIGLDFDWSRPYYLALKLILPRTAAPEVIRPEIEMIRNVNDSNRDCDYQMSFNKTLKSSLLANVPAYRAYFGSRYTDLEPFKGKVAVINLYCYNCTVSAPGEGVSNWPLVRIEPDILRYFLPFCEGDFTLFDLSENNDVVKPYRAYGQFLIIAKNQR